MFVLLYFSTFELIYEHRFMFLFELNCEEWLCLQACVRFPYSHLYSQINVKSSFVEWSCAQLCFVFVNLDLVWFKIGSCIVCLMYCSSIDFQALDYGYEIACFWDQTVASCCYFIGFCTSVRTWFVFFKTLIPMCSCCFIQQSCSQNLNIILWP